MEYSLSKAFKNMLFKPNYDLNSSLKNLNKNHKKKKLTKKKKIN